MNFGREFKFSLFATPGVDGDEYTIYNTLLCGHAILEYCDIGANIHLGKAAELAVRLNISSVPNLLAKVVADLTANDRFGGKSCTGMAKLCRVLVPYTRIHLVCLNYARCNDASSLLGSLFDSELNSSLSNVNFKNGKFMGSASIYRGKFDSSLVENYTKKMRSRQDFNFVDWHPRNVFNSYFSEKGGDSLSAPLSAVQLNNHTSALEVFGNISERFEQLLEEKKFLD